jgi:ribosomal protein S18 acetylase RimI-like enzyme
MESATHESLSRVDVRPLTPDDLDAVVALDRRITGESRRGYFEKRLAAALLHPKRNLQLAATTQIGLAGFVLARVVDGEYGRVGPAGVLEAVGVDPAARHAGLGRHMLSALGHRLNARDVSTIVTQVDWRNHSMLAFLDRAGFVLGPRHVLERKVHRMPLPVTDEEIERVPPLVRHLRAGDLEMIARIDQMLTGQDRSTYLQRKVDEALHESAICVSLVAEDDGFVVAFATARVDFGDFGHVRPTAALDTIGVNPGFSHRGFAHALLTQMIDNLAALHVESLETEVARTSFDLLGLLYGFGFHPSQRLSFERSTLGLP